MINRWWNFTDGSCDHWYLGGPKKDAITYPSPVGTIGLHFKIITTMMLLRLLPWLQSSLTSAYSMILLPRNKQLCNPQNGDTTEPTNCRCRKNVWVIQQWLLHTLCTKQSTLWAGFSPRNRCFTRFNNSHVPKCETTRCCRHCNDENPCIDDNSYAGLLTFACFFFKSAKARVFAVTNTFESLVTSSWHHGYDLVFRTRQAAEWVWQGLVNRMPGFIPIKGLNPQNNKALFHQFSQNPQKPIPGCQTPKLVFINQGSSLKKTDDYKPTDELFKKNNLQTDDLYINQSDDLPSGDLI